MNKSLRIFFHKFRRKRFSVQLSISLFIIISYFLVILYQRMQYHYTNTELDKWPPIKMFVYKIPSYFNRDWIFSSTTPDRTFIDPFKGRFNRFAEVLIHRMSKKSPIRTKNPKEANIFYVPFYSKIFHSNLYKDPTPELWSNLTAFGPYLERNNFTDHALIQSAPNYGDAPLDQYISSETGPIISSMDFSINIFYSVWAYARSILIPFVSYFPGYENWLLQYENQYKNLKNKNINNTNIKNNYINRTISFFVAQAQSHRNLNPKASKLRTNLSNILALIPNAVVLEISRKGEKNMSKVLHQIAKNMIKSEFCLIPFGDAPSSKRFYDAINYLCIPVIVSDYVFYPYEGLDIDYEKFVIQIPQNEMNFSKINSIIKEYGPEKRSKMREEMIKVRDKLIYSLKRPKVGDAYWRYIWALYDRYHMLSPYYDPWN